MMWWTNLPWLVMIVLRLAHNRTHRLLVKEHHTFAVEAPADDLNKFAGAIALNAIPYNEKDRLAQIYRKILLNYANRLMAEADKLNQLNVKIVGEFHNSK